MRDGGAALVSPYPRHGMCERGAYRTSPIIAASKRQRHADPAAPDEGPRDTALQLGGGGPTAGR